MENLLIVFIALTAAAILLQAGLLAGMYLAMRKSSARLESVAEQVKNQVLPTVAAAQAALNDLRPKVEQIVENVTCTSAGVRAEVERVDAAVNDVLDRVRLQVIRADEMLTRTFDRLEQTSEVVQKTVVSPMRHFSGVVQGVTAGLEFLFAGRAQKNGGNREARRAVPQDEMFI